MKLRLELKVGLFVFIGLALLGLLLIGFSKGTTLFRPTYTHSPSSNRCRGFAEKCGCVDVRRESRQRIRNHPRSRWEKRYHQFEDISGIRHSQRRDFSIGAIRVSGGPVCRIQPNENKKMPFADMDEATADPAFSIQAAARTATGFVERLDHSLSKLDDTLDQMRRLIFNEETLTNLSSTVATLRQVSEKASITVQNVNSLLASNSPAIDRSGSNLVVFSEQMSQFANA
jgi:hypothetical protein